MKAEEARKLSDFSLPKLIKDKIERITQTIRVAAGVGHYEVTIYKDNFIPTEEWESISDYLKTLGYEVEPSTTFMRIKW